MTPRGTGASALVFDPLLCSSRLRGYIRGSKPDRWRLVRSYQALNRRNEWSARRRLMGTSKGSRRRSNPPDKRNRAMDFCGAFTRDSGSKQIWTG